MPSAPSGKRKQAWEKIYGGPGASSSCFPSSSSITGVNELTTYLDSDPVTDWGESFDILLWQRGHKLTYPILSIMASDIMFIRVYTVSSKSCFSCTARILEDRRRCLLPKSMWRCSPTSRTGTKQQERNSMHLRTSTWRSFRQFVAR